MFTLQHQKRILVVDKPQVMGVINLTPDSFYAESRLQQTDALLRRAEQMLQQGATILDVGGQSTRPGSTPLDAAAECARVLEPIAVLCERFPEAFVSVDTYHAAVAEQALQAGAFMVNDVSGGTLDPAMLSTVAKAQAPYVVMHMRGTPATMQQFTGYTDVTQEVIQYLQERLHHCRQAGIRDVVVDPGFGFAKTAAQNFTLLSRLQDFSVLKAPLLLGISRKSFIYKTLGVTPEEALNGSTFLHAIGLQKGALLLRVHDVKEAVEAVRLWENLH